MLRRDDSEVALAVWEWRDSVGMTKFMSCRTTVRDLYGICHFNLIVFLQIFSLASLVGNVAERIYVI